jgi:ABC-type multidrug transport system fused ATPase/permease subunit
MLWADEKQLLEMPCLVSFPAPWAIGANTELLCTRQLLQPTDDPLIFTPGTSTTDCWTPSCEVSHSSSYGLFDTNATKGTIRFFNVTPTGRIINRFSRDVETIDSSLNGGLRTVIVYVASLIGAVVSVICTSLGIALQEAGLNLIQAVVTAIVPWFLIPAAAISYLYYRYSLLYVSSASRYWLIC